jgi:hypothetical protein
MMYAASDSGVVVLPVGSLNRTPRIASSHEDVLLRGNTCDHQMLSGEIDITDPGGGATDFTVQVLGSSQGLRISASSATTPARVRIEVDPTAYQNERGTTVVPIQIWLHEINFAARQSSPLSSLGIYVNQNPHSDQYEAECTW